MSEDTPSSPGNSTDVTTATPASLREGADLVRACKPFTEEDRPRTWRLLFTSLAAFAGLVALAALLPLWPLRLAAGLLAGMVLVRLFIFFHDHLHGAIFADSALGKVIIRAIGVYTLNPPSVWKETHDYHHQNNAKLLGASIGSYPVVTVRMWQNLTPQQRFFYAFARHPLTIALGYFTIFSIGMCLSPFRRDPRRHWQGPATLLAHWALVATVAALAGVSTAFFAVVLPVMVANGAGAYLFYAQHNFPAISLRDRRDWQYWYAAVHSSSMFDMPGWMHWLTGNIGYHHVHHLNHKIPFYRLPEAMAAMPELQSPGRTSWRPSDVRGCLRLKLWDADKQQMVGWEAVR
jgi:omega-6 fatty acid desaturase (delta-12 desaturase)